MSHEMPAPVEVGLPPDFPITWENEQDRHLPLLRDRQHSPEPVTPLTGAMHEEHFSAGSTRGFERAGQPLRFDVRRINTYYYIAVHPSVAPEEMEAAGARVEAGAQEAIGHFVDRWDNEWVPEVQGCYRQWEDFDLQGSTMEELLAHVAWTRQTFERFWDIHMEVTLPYMLAPASSRICTPISSTAAIRWSPTSCCRGSATAA